jgi:undecaprenyl-phosphate galactose phosphotransferase
VVYTHYEIDASSGAPINPYSPEMATSQRSSRALDLPPSETACFRGILKILKDHSSSQLVAADGVDFSPRVRPKLAPIICSISFLAADLIAAALAEAAAVGVQFLLSDDYQSALPIARTSVFNMTIILAVTISYLALRGRYTARTPFWAEASQLFSASCWAFGVQFLAGFFAGHIVSHAPQLLTFVLFPILATFATAFAKTMLVQLGSWRLPIVLIGTGEAALAVEAALASDPSLGYSIVSRVDPQRILDRSNSAFLWAILKRHQASQILFAVDDDSTLQRQLIDAALRDKVPFAIAPGPHAMPALAWQPTRFFSHDVVMLSFQHSMSRTLEQAVKTALDVMAAAILLVLSSPIFLIAALFNLSSDGPLFFAHQRLGTGGKMFPCLKFRTMVVDGDRVLQEALARDPALQAEWQATQKLRHDPRITAFGRFLRKTSLDELPQLINVIRREMSLVGPRPIVPSEVHFYGDDIAHYYNARPGVTGLWQVSGRSNTTYARRVQLDVWYVNNWSVWLDVAVLLKTLPAVLSRSGAH